ncbi:hypothetical protein KGF54_001951 [Candida jiufengensis]|uniref:uncharacterized protein n=1 Tax=Candida jiufengensis TaxID=497108 RepID=UPI0022247973|nr:uncharacterized protein KGF54_001951 [Candida jiufengensis]KAI5954176.1 hypothetical protein KGF54_001951 [Candida jiufengensis]
MPNLDDLDIDIETDDTLGLERQYYDIGYKEGIDQSTKEQYLEGKQFGYQTGFQRFLIVGYIRGLIQDWELNLKKYDNQQSLNNHLSQIKSCMDKISLVNNDKEVEKFEINLRKSRNKLRVLVGITKESWKIDNLDELINKVGGNMQISENVDDMW